MLDVSVSCKKYQFLGLEFLTWLWFVMEQTPELLNRLDPEMVSLEIGNRVTLENRQTRTKEVVTIKGNDAGLEEGRLALQKGALVAELNLCYRSGEYEWRFSIKGENFNISNLKCPDIGPTENQDDLEAALIEAISLQERIVELVDKIFNHFIRLRISDAWHSEVVRQLRKWILS